MQADWLAKSKADTGKGKYFHLQGKELPIQEPNSEIASLRAAPHYQNWRRKACAWELGGSEPPSSLDCIFQGQKWEMSPFCLQPQISNIMASTHPLPQHPKKILRRHAGVISAEPQRAASRDSFHILGKRKISEDTKPDRYRKLQSHSTGASPTSNLQLLIHVFFSKILACWEVDLVPLPQPHYRNNVQTSEMQRLETPSLGEGLLAVAAGQIQ